MQSTVSSQLVQFSWAVVKIVLSQTTGGTGINCRTRSPYHANPATKVACTRMVCDQLIAVVTTALRPKVPTKQPTLIRRNMRANYLLREGVA